MEYAEDPWIAVSTSSAVKWMMSLRAASVRGIRGLLPREGAHRPGNAPAYPLRA